MPQATAVSAAPSWFSIRDESGEPRLLGKRCEDCGRVYFPPPALRCPDPTCRGARLTLRAMSRHGRLWSFTVNRYQPPPPFPAPSNGAEFKPFAVAAVELAEEQIVVIGQMVEGVDGESLRVGDSVALDERLLCVVDDVPHLTWAWRPVHQPGRATP